MSDSIQSTTRVRMLRHMYDNATEGLYEGGQKALAETLGVHFRTVNGILSSLVEKGDITVLRTGQGRNPSLYRVNSADAQSRADVWSKEKVDELRFLRSLGKTKAEIAKHFKVTRNSIVGKISRLLKSGDLEKLPLDIKPKGIAAPKPLAVARSATAAPRPSRATRPVVPPLAILNKTSVSIIARPKIVEIRTPTPPVRPKFVADNGVDHGPSLHPCQWPVRDGSVIEPWVFCGVERAVWPYCAGHMKRAYGRQSEAA